jgi:hypothetical protein
MHRIKNFLHRVVKDEDSATEFLCNLMSIKVFREKFLEMFLDPKVLKEIQFEDFETQISFNDGRPDMFVENDTTCIIFESKIDKRTSLTRGQPSNYLEYLSGKRNINHRYLVFLLPKGYFYEEEIQRREAEFRVQHPENEIKVERIYWEEIIEVIEDNELDQINPFVGEFTDLLRLWYLPKAIKFSFAEVEVMFSSEVPRILRKLQEVVDGVAGKNTSYGMYKSRAGEEYGYYFKDSDGNQVLWFGIWYPFWDDHGIPLCFGVKQGFPQGASFRSKYKNRLLEYKSWILTWINKEILMEDANIIETIWSELDQLLAGFMQKP